MVHLYRAAVYLLMIGAGIVLYLLLRRVFHSRPKVLPIVGALLATTGLLWCTHFALSKPALLKKYAPALRITGARSLNMLYSQIEVRICSPDGSGDTLFLPGDFITTRDITWSPDGSRIACSRVRPNGDGANLYIYDADGENPVQLTSGDGVCRRPSWSPDGSRIVFDYRPSPRTTSSVICVMNADGSDRRTLSGDDHAFNYHPVWSPNGRDIYHCVKIKRRDDIWVMDVGGGNLRQLTFTPERSETELAVSPDGSTIALAVNRREIFLMDADGSNLRPLTMAEGGTCQGRDPSWSPDGERILYAGFGPDKLRKFIKEIRTDGTGLRQITPQEGKFLNPVLAPDGSRLVYLKIIKSVIRQMPAGRKTKAAGDKTIS